MKKILTIVVVALALCLLASVALATTYSGKLFWYNVEELLRDSANVYELNKSETLYNIIKIEPGLDKLDTLDAHGKYVNAKITGTSTATGKNVTTEVKVMMSNHRGGYNHGDYMKIDEQHSNNCEEGGVRVWVCTYPGCTYTETEKFLPKPHVLVEVDTATCTKTGKKYDVCSACGWFAKDKLGNPVYKKDADGKVIETPALGHKPSDKWGTDVQCDPDTQRLTDGYVYNICSRCGNFIDDDTKVEVKGGTDLDKQAIIATKINKWSLLYAHDFESKPYEILEPTCEEKGGASYWCKRCGFLYAKYNDAQPALGHIWGLPNYISCRDLRKMNKDNFEWVCERCGEYAKPTATNKVPKYDDNGNEIGSTFIATIDDVEYSTDVVHDYSNVHREYYRYDYNGGLYEVGSKDDMKWRSAKERKAFCENAIKYVDAQCTICDRYYNRMNEGSVGHTWGEWEIVNDKEDVGTTTSRFQRECEVCDALQVKVASGMPCGDGEHDYVPVDKTKLVCGSLNEGTKLICTKCGATTVGEYFIEDHDWEVIAPITAATCEKGGREVVKCKICNAYDERETDPAGHVVTKIDAVEPTCKEPGHEAYWVCEVCGKYFSDAEAKNAIKVPVPVAKTENHVWDEGVVTKPATVEADGVKTYTCTICGKTKTEAITKLLPATEIDKFDATFDTKDNVLTGKAVVKTGTEEPAALFARVTFFFSNGTYNVGSVQLAEDGTFEYMTGVDVVHVAVQIVNNNKVRPGDFTSYTGKEFDVK